VLGALSKVVNCCLARHKLPPEVNCSQLQLQLTFCGLVQDSGVASGEHARLEGELDSERSKVPSLTRSLSHTHPHTHTHTHHTRRGRPPAPGATSPNVLMRSVGTP